MQDWGELSAVLMSSTGAPQETYTVILFTYKNIKVDTLEQVIFFQDYAIQSKTIHI